MVGKNKKPGTKKPWNTTKFIHDKKCEVPRWEQKLDRLLLYGCSCFFCTDSSLLLSSVLSKLTLEEKKNLCFVLFDYFSWYIAKNLIEFSSLSLVGFMSLGPNWNIPERDTQEAAHIFIFQLTSHPPYICMFLRMNHLISI